MKKIIKALKGGEKVSTEDLDVQVQRERVFC